MEQKLDCITVSDLLPNYLEKLTNEITNKRIAAHLESCGDCRHLLAQLTAEIVVETAPETKEFKHYIKKSKIESVIKFLIITGIIAIGICLIVDLAVSHKLTWSYITTGGILLAILPANVALHSKNNKMIKAFGCLTGCLYVFLGMVEIVINQFFLKEPVYWFFTLALPITTIWVFILWSSILMIHGKKIGVFGVCAAICFMTIPGNIFTNWIANGSIADRTDLLINGICVSILGILLICLEQGHKALLKRKMKNK